MAATTPSFFLVIAALLAQTGEPPDPAAKDEPPAAAAEEAVDVTADAPPPSEWDRRQAAKEDTELESSEEERSFIAQLAKTLIALLVVCGILYLVGKVAISRLSNVRFGGGGGQAIKIVEKLQLDPRTSLYLVQVDEGGPRLLLGTGEKGVHLISRLDTTPDSVETGPSTEIAFQEVLVKTATMGHEAAGTNKEQDERQKE